MDFLSTFITVLIVVVLAVPGYVLRKTKILPDGATGVLAGVLLYVSQPGLMASSFLNKKFDSAMLVNFGWVILFAVVLILLVYFVSKLIFFRCKDEASRRACVACSYLGNVGFMGIPVMQMLFPGNDDLVLYTAVYNIAFNAMTWTLGIYSVTGDKKSVNPLKIILNPPTVATIIVLPLFFCNVAVPEQVVTPVQYLGNMTLPLSMIILGIRLADMHPLRLVTENVSGIGGETGAFAAAVFGRSARRERAGAHRPLCDRGAVRDRGDAHGVERAQLCRNVRRRLRHGGRHDADVYLAVHSHHSRADAAARICVSGEVCKCSVQYFVIGTGGFPQRGNRPFCNVAAL